MPDARPIAFTGTFHQAVDAATKRVTIPAKWRRRGLDFYILPNPNGQCLSAFTLEEYQSTFDKIDARSDITDAQKAALKRAFGSKTHTTTCDAQGRAVLDADHLHWAGITSQAMLIGRVSNFEIWSPEKWRQAQQQVEGSLPELAKLVGL